jgi:sterol 3beta-glucosyltransferase
MASHDSDRGAGKTMRKRKESIKEARGVSLDIPERFKDGDDAHEDVTAPKRNDAISMNQSIFSMIARAGQQSQVDLGTMQEVDSGESDEESNRKSPFRSLDGAARLSKLSTTNDFERPQKEAKVEKTEQPKHRRALSENKLLRSLPRLRTSSKKEARTESQQGDEMSSSQLLPPRISTEAATQKPRVTPKIARGEIYVEKVRNMDSRSKLSSTASLIKRNEPVTLASRVQQIFEFVEVEEVISEYPCWLLQNILLQGYMYITQKHVCFYAYIPRKHVRTSLFPTPARLVTST